MNHDASWFERQYNVRLSIENVPALIAAWFKRSTRVRSSLMPLTDFKYGSHPRENLDLFRVPGAKSTLVFIHGGYWRAFSKLETSFIAEHFVARGISVALINYPLCPDVTVSDIRDSALRAFAYVWTKVLTDDEQRTVVIAGHSAGGHLAALHATVDWTTRGLPTDAIKGIMSLSGLFDLEPLLTTSMNADIRLTPETALPLNLMNTQPMCRPQLVLAAGGDETMEFQRQSQDLGKAWNTLSPELISVLGANHFTIVDTVADPASDLHQTLLHMLGA